MLCRDIAVQHKQSSAGTLAVEESVEPGDDSGCHCVPCEEAQGQRDTDTGTKSRVRANEASELIKAFQISKGFLIPSGQTYSVWIREHYQLGQPPKSIST